MALPQSSPKRENANMIIMEAGEAIPCDVVGLDLYEIRRSLLFIFLRFKIFMFWLYRRMFFVTFCCYSGLVGSCEFNHSMFMKG